MTTAEPRTEPLRGWQVLVTRPAGVADSLCAALTDAGAIVHRAPVLAIEALPETTAARALAQDLDRFDVVIVTSRHAVQFGVDRLAEYWPQWPAGVCWLAVGRATAAALAVRGITAAAPDDARSEGLLALPQLNDIAGRRVLLLTGEGGRGLLEQALTARGARLERLAAYRRTENAEAGRALAAWRALPVPAAQRAVLVTSGDALQNLLARAPWLRTQDALVVAAGERIAALARDGGLPRVVAATGADDDNLLAALLAARHSTDHAGAAGQSDEDRA
ncbi:MAG: uroporphyrinogen-III synthase [Pseudomonadota bacterium]